MQSRCETLLCRYRYDALDQLIVNELSNVPPRQRFYCESRLAAEIQGAMRYSIIQHEDQLLAQQQSGTGAPGTTLLATDQQRSVLHTLRANQPRQPIAYSPYGHRPTASRLLSLLGFNGERPDPVTGCYLLGKGYRAFNPVLMRFNSPDSLSPFEKGGLNPYAYCLGNPANYIDPTGHRSMLPRGSHRWPERQRQLPRLNNRATAHQTISNGANQTLARQASDTPSPFPEKSAAWTTGPFALSNQSERRSALNSLASDTSSVSAISAESALPNSRLIASPSSAARSAHGTPNNRYSLSRNAPFDPPPDYELPPPYSLLTAIANTQPVRPRNIFRSLIHNIRRLGNNIRRGART